MMNTEKQYKFDDFRLDKYNRREVEMTCGISIPINNPADVPVDIMEVVNRMINQTMHDYEKKHGQVNNITDLELCVALEIGEDQQRDRHSVQVFLIDSVGQKNDASNLLYVHPEDAYYSSFAEYCSRKLFRYLFAA